jgi:hypothetical protein
MKTIRTNCFETNSSSTHSYTVNAPSDLSLKPAQTFVTEDGIVRVKVNAGEPSDSLLGKLSFLLSATYFIGDQAAFDRVVKVAEEFAKVKLEISNREWVNGKWVEGPVTKVLDHGTPAAREEGDDDDDDGSEHPAAETIRDEYCSWVNEAGHENADEFINEVSEIVQSEQAILVFVFSDSHPFRTETYYN